MSDDNKTQAPAAEGGSYWPIRPVHNRAVARTAPGEHLYCR
jgi:hypothetical protein